MPGAFDPYHLWLGILPEEQPPNHYRLLGLAPFEDRPETIRHAADQRVADLRTFQPGRHAGLCEKLLDEVAAARACLLNPQKKAAYDRRLRQTLQPEAADAEKPPRARQLGNRPGSTGQAAMADEPGWAGAEPAGSISGAKGATVESTRLGQLGEYQLLEKLGEGGMGAVYKARHTKLKRVVALKVLPKGRMEDDRAIARFEREMEAVGRLDHSNVVRAMDAREVQGTWFLVMELVEGMDLAKVVRQCGPLPIADACELIRQAALGLQSAHEHGLVHRDVKPSNLMLTHQGQVKVLDLGLARFQSGQPAGEEMTGTGQALGTIDYMAPEQISDTHAVDIRADVYGLGCTLYKLLTGRAPFSGPKYQSTFEKMRGHLEKPVPPIRKSRRDVPEELAAVVNRMLAKDPAARFATPAEVADAIGPWAAGRDLPSLLARAEGKPPVVEPSQALAATAESPSSLTRFLQRLKAEQREPGAQPPVAGGHRREKTAIIVGFAAVGLLLLALLVVWGVKSHDKGPSEAAGALVFDWPESQREGTTLFIDRKTFRFPASGPLKVPCKPGEYQIHAVREGFKPYHEVIKVKAGRSMEISPVWLPQSYLVLQWPIDQRRNAKLEIDGQAPDLTDPAIETAADQIKMPIEAGPHKVWIVRRGFEPFEQTFTIDDGKGLTIKPDWKRLAEQREPGDGQTAAGPSVTDGEPAPDSTAVAQHPQATATEQSTASQEKPPALSEAQRQKIAEMEAREARYARALDSAEAMVSGWDFRGAAAALAKLDFDEEEFAARLARRRQEVRRLAELKARMIDKINTARPPLRKSALLLRGLNGDVVGADEDALAARLPNRKTESFAWHNLSQRSTSKLLEFVVDRENADELLTGGLLALACKDADLAEDYFEEARTLGADIEPYLAKLAAVAFARANELLEEGEFREADALLRDIEEKYAKLSWYSSNKMEFDAARAEARTGIIEAEAEKLYVQAAKLLKKKQLFDLKPLVEKLKTDYANTRPITDTYRKPSLAEMEEAVADLGEFITVRLDGKGDYVSIQEAINAAPPNSLIEIQDNGPYNEKLIIPDEKEGLRLRGGKGRRPIITSVGPRTNFAVLMTVKAPRTVLERLVLAHGGAGGRSPKCVSLVTGPQRIYSCVLFGTLPFENRTGAVCEFTNCVIVGSSWMSGPIVMANCVWLGGFGYTWTESTFSNVLFSTGFPAPGCEFRSCTIGGHLKFGGNPGTLVDCIVPSIESVKPGTRIDYCNVYKRLAFIDLAKPGKGCFSAPPQFVDAKNLDYRLMPTSPCIGKASDGGDIGFRYTPEMLEMCKLALELRQKGIIKF